MAKMRCKTMKFLDKTESRKTSNNPKTAATVVTILGFKAFIPKTNYGDDEVNIFSVEYPSSKITITKYNRYDANGVWNRLRNDEGYEVLADPVGLEVLNAHLKDSGLPQILIPEEVPLGEDTAKTLLQKAQARRPELVIPPPSCFNSNKTFFLWKEAEVERMNKKG